MSCPFCGTPEGQGACACCGHFIAKEQPEPDPEETEALTDLRTIGGFMNLFDQAAEAHFEHQNNNEERRYK